MWGTVQILGGKKQTNKQNICTVNQRIQRERTQCFLKRGADEVALDRDVKARANIVEYRED